MEARRFFNELNEGAEEAETAGRALDIGSLTVHRRSAPAGVVAAMEADAGTQAAGELKEDDDNVVEALTATENGCTGSDNRSHSASRRHAGQGEGKSDTTSEGEGEGEAAQTASTGAFPYNP